MKALGTALMIGISASLVLFWLMQAMIMPDPQAVKKAEPLHRVEFVRLKREPPKPPEPQPKPPEPAPPVASKKAPPPKKVPPVKPPVKVQPKAPPQKPLPDIPPLDLAAPAAKSSAAPVRVPPAGTSGPAEPSKAAAAGNTAEAGPGAGTGISSDVVALVRVPPKYPPRAANRRIEGWVKIEFTITTAGTVKEAVVVEAQPAEVFDQVALAAIRHWQFKEKRVNGSAVEQRAVQVLQFKLAK